MRIGTFALAAGFVACAASNHVLHEKRDAIPKEWVKRSRLPSDVQLPMRIGLQQSNLEKGEELLMEISDPDSPRFGQHYTQEQIHELFAPAKEAVEATIAWLQSANISRERIEQTVNKQWIAFDATVEEAERLFKTKYHEWEHRPTGRSHPACDEYHVPEHIKHHIDYITPGLKLFAGAKRPRDPSISKRSDLLNRQTSPYPGPIIGPVVSLDQGLTKGELLKLCGTLITPPCVKALYGIPEGTKANPSNKMGVFEEGDYYAAEDLIEFFTLLAPNIDPLTKPILHGIDGGHAPGLVATGESDLDFQLLYPLIHPQQAILFQTDDHHYATGGSKGGFFNTFLDAIDGSYCTLKKFGEKGDSKIDPKYPDPAVGGYKGKLMCGTYKPTNVISVSYGLQEDDLPTNYQRRQCFEFMKLGMQGTTVIFASGDSGVAARSTDDGNSNGCLGKNGTVFNPDAPASCPYVTALGATQLPEGSDVNKNQETAVTSFPSGGGFSNIYQRPSYQDATLNNYFAKHKPSYKSYVTKHNNNPDASVTKGGIYNRGGRGYPDASAVGNNVVIVLDGAPNLVGGTSAAAPIFGSIITRINEERISKGKKSLGFLNPSLYKHPEMFNDITNGTNEGCGTNGFSCVTGWDPVSGLGTPSYPKMLKVLGSLP